MNNDEKTPGEVIDERIKELQEESAGQVANISERVSGVFWTKVRDFFGVAFEDVWKDLISAAPGIFGMGLKTWDAWVDPLVSTDATKSIGEILDRETDPDKILDALERLAERLPMFNALYKVLQFAVTLFGIVSASMTASTELASQEVLAKKKPTLLPLEYAMDALWKDPGTVSLVRNILDRVGLSGEYQDLLIKSSEAVLGAIDARSGLLRGLINETEHDKILTAHHLSDVNIKTIKKLYQIIPPVQDIITMAVREVFTPEIVAKFGQMEGLPEDFVKWAKQQGLSGYWSSAYWAAHWSLPGVGQGFEMMHREVIDQEELEMLLKALDIMPYWRSRLTEISYNPLTRVDVRRMYALGVLNDVQVHKSYKDIGYNEENAALMTQFTIAFTTEHEKDLSKSDILTMYKKHALDRDASKTMLDSLGYSPENTDLLLARADYEMYASYKKKQLGYIQRVYVAGKISESDAVARLGKLNLPANETNYLLETWELDRTSKVRQLTLTNLKDFFSANVITVSELTHELIELGYNAQDTGRFVALFQTEGNA